MSRPSSKDAILDAAEAIVIELGASRMTLDAVAERSGMSKGGLIYNFQTKEALLEAMIGRMTERFDERREQIRHKLPESANELAVDIEMLRGKSRDDHRLSAALLAVTANQPELTAKMREHLRERFFNKTTAQGDFTRSAILFFSALGLHFHDLLNLSLLDDEQKAHIFEALLQLAMSNEEI